MGEARASSQNTGRISAFLYWHFPASSLAFSSSFTWLNPSSIYDVSYDASFQGTALPQYIFIFFSFSSLLFSFCIFFRATEKKLTFTAPCLPSQMRQEKSKPPSLFPSKDLSRVSVLWGDWTHRPEICSDVFSHTSPNLVLLAVCGSQSCLSNLQIALPHVSGCMSQGHPILDSNGI